MLSHYRNCAAWRDQGIILSTTNDEVAKLYDACIAQSVGSYDDPIMGDFPTCLKKMKEADPNFVLTYVLENASDCLGTGRSAKVDPVMKSNIEYMVSLAAKSPNITDRERKHVNAVKLWSEGYIENATTVWDDILIDHPTDVLAIKLNHASYFYLGKSVEMRDNTARVLPHWNDTMPLYSNLLGYYAFGLAETNRFAEAEILSKKALSYNRFDGWSTHALIHTYENDSRTEDGINALSGTVDDWTAYCGLATHLYWHWAVFCIEKKDYEGALGIFDLQVSKRATADSMLDMLDATSLLFRLEMEGVNVGDRWETAYELCRPHLDDHVIVFNDFHLLMGCIGAKKPDVAEKFMKSVHDYLSNESLETTQRLTNEIGLPLYKALLAYDQGDYATAVDLIYPIRYKFHGAGASRAQRDVLPLFLIHASLRSKEPKHQRIARSLLMERKAIRTNCQMTENLLQKSLSHHIVNEH
ncbi:tetratricopeptide repeat protein 38-like [Tubulanus polymorphus]|uniref:tetratricopeptide repeat protein 38-like n=1 Tax=Tubulanus polymorphus TaxID=672921 RepID=UPI003DA6BDFA